MPDGASRANPHSPPATRPLGGRSTSRPKKRAQPLRVGYPHQTARSLEAQDLNLEGTELVVLSACETALGQIDYGEGVSGLVRALRTAGARNVLVTLRPVSDPGAADFMQRFYHQWLGQEGRSDP